MRHHLYHLLIFMGCIAFFTGCGGGKRQQDFTARLMALDSLIDAAPQAVKEAVKIGEDIDMPDKRLMAIGTYYLGLLHDGNENLNDASRYFNKALEYAKIIDDEGLIFHNKYELAWNKPKNGQTGAGEMLYRCCGAVQPSCGKPSK